MMLKGQTKHFPYYLAGLGALLTFLVFLPDLQNDFVEWDDNDYIFENPHIRSIGPDFFNWAFTSFHVANWHPLTWVSHALDYAVWGLNPLGHHLTNNILHSINTFLVVLLVMKLLASRQAGKPESLQAGKLESLKADKPIHDSRFTIHDLHVVDHSPFTIYHSHYIAAGVTGLLFGIHPIHVESVVWVSERKDLLCALFYLLSVMAYTSYRSHATYKTYMYSLCFFILALLSKPMAVSLPVVLLILDWYPFGRISSLKTFRSAFIEKLPFIVLSIGSSVVTMIAQKSGGAMGMMEVVPLSARLLVAAKSLVSYLFHILFPNNLLFFYPYPKHISFLSGDYILSVLLVAGITAGCILLFRKSRLWLSVWGYYVLTLLPVLGIVQVGMQARADRYTYLPGIGPSLLIGLALAWVFTKAVSSGKKRAAVAGLSVTAALLLIFLSATTVQQISVWKDSITLWSSIIEKEPERAFFAFHNRGIAYSRRGEYDKAIEDYRMAIALRPEFADTYSNLGIALLKKGFPEEAIRNYRTAIQLAPRLINAHRNLAVALFTSGRFSEALEHYLVVADLRPEDAGAQNDLGSVYGAMGAYEKAIEHFQNALRLRPGLADAHYNLAMALQAVGRMKKAQEHFDAALRNQ